MKVDSNKLITGGSSEVNITLDNGDRVTENLFNNIVCTVNTSFGSASFINGETVTYPTVITYAGQGSLARGSNSFLRKYVSDTIKNKRPGKFDMTITESDMEGNEHTVLAKGVTITSPLNVLQAAVGTASLTESITFTIEDLIEPKTF